MKIAFWHNLPSGGGNRALYDQVRGLVARGHHVEIWCPPTAERSFLPLGGYAVEHVLPMTVNAASNRYRVAPKIMVKYQTLMAEIEAMDQHCRACAEEINRSGFDLVLAHASKAFHPTPIGRYVKVPSAIYLQEPNRYYYEAMPRLPWVALDPRNGRPKLGYYKDTIRDLIFVQSRRILIREELASAGDFDLILANSLFSRESILRAYGLESRVCYLGIDIELFQPTDDPKRGYVIGLGNIAPNKRPDLAIEALGTIEEQARPELIWIGNTASEPYLNDLKGLASRLGVQFQSKVNVPNAELVDMLANASAMIYTSRLEPFGYAPLEANACGTAVVAVAEGGVRETVVDGLNGTLLIDADPAALGQAILDYTANPSKAKAVGLAARRHVEGNWGLESSIDRLEANLEKLRDLEQSRGRSQPDSLKIA